MQEPLNLLNLLNLITPALLHAKILPYLAPEIKPRSSPERGSIVGRSQHKTACCEAACHCVDIHRIVFYCEDSEHDLFLLIRYLPFFDKEKKQKKASS